MSKLKDKQYLPKQLTTTGAEPSVPSSDYKSDGTWVATDTYKGEITANLADDKLWYRTDNGQIELLNADNGTLEFENTFSNGLTVVVASGAKVTMIYE